MATVDTIRVAVSRGQLSVLDLPTAVSRVDRDAFARPFRRMTLDESLRGTPGVVVQYRRNEALGDRLMVRGAGARAQFGIRGVRVLVDGIPLTTPDGQTTLTNLDLASTGGAEVLRGPSSALYGNASAGVIGFRTAFAGPGWSATPEIHAGSYGYGRGRLVAGFGGDRTDALFAGGVTRVEGYRRYSSYSSSIANLSVRHRAGERTWLNAVASYYDLPFAENPSSLTAEQVRDDPRQVRPFIVSQGAGKAARQGQVGLGIRQAVGRSELRGTGWLVLREVWNPIPGRIIDLDRTAAGARAALAGTSGGSASWTVGLDLEAQSDDRLEFENLGTDGTGQARPGAPLVAQDENVLALSPFGRLDLLAGSRWTLSFAGRFDNYRYEIEDRRNIPEDASGSRTFRAFSPAFGAGYALDRNATLYASLSTAFTTPTTSELSNRPDGDGGFNESLQPERLLGAELGARGEVPGVKGWFDAVIYLSRVRDALVPRQSPDEEVFFTNAGEVRRDGIELAAGAAVNPRFRLSGAATVARRRFETFATPSGDFSGNEEPGSPEAYVTLQAAWLALPGLETRLSWRWTDRYAVNDANTETNPSWSVLDLSVRFRTGRAGMLDVVAGIDNLLGERYSASVVPNAFGGRYFEPSPGFEVYIGLAARLRPD